MSTVKGNSIRNKRRKTHGAICLLFTMISFSAICSLDSTLVGQLTVPTDLSEKSLRDDTNEDVGGGNTGSWIGSEAELQHMETNVTWGQDDDVHSGRYEHRHQNETGNINDTEQGNTLSGSQLQENIPLDQVETSSTTNNVRIKEPDLAITNVDDDPETKQSDSNITTNFISNTTERNLQNQNSVQLNNVSSLENSESENTSIPQPTHNRSRFDSEENNVQDFSEGILSKYQYDEAGRYMFLYVLPFVVLFGLVGNVLSLHCLLQVPDGDSVSVYLCALACTDMVTLFCFVLEWFPLMLSQTREFEASLIRAHLFIPVEVFLKLSASCSSTYLIVLMSIGKLLAVARPLQMRHNCITRYPKLISGSVVFIVTTFFLLNIWRYEIKTVEDSATNRTRYEVSRSRVAQENEFFNVYGLIGQIVFNFASTCIILVCTVLTIVYLFRQTKQKWHITDQQVVDRQTNMRRVTWILVTIAFIHTISALPTCVIGILSKFSEEVKLFGKEHYLVYLIYDIGDLLSAINSSVNFLVYIVLSSRFRGSFITLITCSRDKYKNSP